MGKSHSGNVAALELAQVGALRILASDYLPSSMLMAAFALARKGLLSPFEALQLITENPAKAAGLNDRGVLAAGYRADLVLCSEISGSPRVLRTLTTLD